MSNLPSRLVSWWATRHCLALSGVIGCFLVLTMGLRHGTGAGTTGYPGEFGFYVAFSGDTQEGLTARPWAVAEGGPTELVIARGGNTVPWVIHWGLLALYATPQASNLTAEAFFSVCPHRNGTVNETTWTDYYLVPSEGYYQAPNGSHHWFAAQGLVDSLNESLHWGPFNITAWRWNGTALYKNIAFQEFFDAELLHFADTHSQVKRMAVTQGYQDPSATYPNWRSIFDVPPFRRERMRITDPPGTGWAYIGVECNESVDRKEEVEEIAAAVTEELATRWYVGRIGEEIRFPNISPSWSTTKESPGFALGAFLGVSLTVLLARRHFARHRLKIAAGRER